MKISPSILSADFANLGAEVKRICDADADFIHVDVMDGVFVNNLTIGPMVIKAIKKHSTIPLDVHLMIENPQKSVDQYIEAGADIITFHVESLSASEIKTLIKYIQSRNIKVGISLRPSTSIDSIIDYIKDIDLVLVMTVEPGWGGQKFMNTQLKKISDLKKIAEQFGPKLISADGGINDETATLCARAGANMLVSGSWLFSQKDMKSAINALRNYQI